MNKEEKLQIIKLLMATQDTLQLDTLDHAAEVLLRGDISQETRARITELTGIGV